MSVEDYIEPRVVETSVDCDAITRLPRLPVRILVLARGEEQVGLAARVLRTIADLGAGGALDAVEERWERWSDLEHPREDRFDAVVLRTDGLPSSTEDPDRPDPRCAEVVESLLRRLGARFWALDQTVFSETAGEQQRRAEALARGVVALGGAPAIHLPMGWDATHREGFLTGLFEHALHDAPLHLAVDRARDKEVDAPTLYVSADRRHGLDLARLLEDHRSNIDALATRIRIFQREVEADRPSEEGSIERWAALRDSVGERHARLTALRERCAEIDRDRDPAGWSRLSENIDGLARLEDALTGDRTRREALEGSSP